MFRTVQHDQDGQDPADQGGQGRAKDSPAEDVDGCIVAGDVEDIRPQHNEHGELGVPGGAEDHTARLEQGDEGDGQSDDIQIVTGAPEHIRGNVPVQPVQDEGPAAVEDPHEHQGDQPGHPDQLPPGFPGPFLFPVAQVLAHDHGAPGGQGHEHQDQQHHDVVDERNAGYRRFPQGSRHQGIGESGQDHQELFDDERQEQPEQIPVGEKEPLAPRRGQKTLEQ